MRHGALIYPLDLWGQTLDRVREVSGKFNSLEDAFASEGDNLSTRFSSETTANENFFLCRQLEQIDRIISH